MNKLITSLAVILLTFSFARAQDKTQEMEDLLQTTFAKFDTTLNVAVMMPLSTELDLIAEKYSDQWVAQYYAAYAKVMIAYMEPDVAKKDLILDEGDLFLENIEAMNIQNEERYIIAAMLANSRMAVDGEHRWKEYGPIFDENLKKAKEINPDNPHIYYLKGTALFYTPKMFGGGGKKALPYFEKAKALFPKMDKTNMLIPFWGEDKNTYYMGEISKEK